MLLVSQLLRCPALTLNDNDFIILEGIKIAAEILKTFDCAITDDLITILLLHFASSASAERFCLYSSLHCFLLLCNAIREIKRIITRTRKTG